MKRASQSQPEPEPVRRFNGIGIALVALGLLVFLFVFVGPWVERNAHLIELDYLEDPERVESGLRTLCRTDIGKKELNANLAARDVAERVRIVAVAAKLSCLDELDPGFRAEYYLYDEEHGDTAQVVAQSVDAIEPAIEALGFSESLPRERAARALFALAEMLDGDQRTRALKRLEETPEGEREEASRSLLATLAPPEDHDDMGEVAPEFEPEPSEPSTQPDAGVLLDMGALELDPALKVRGADALERTTLELKAPLKLDEPELDPPKRATSLPGVLFERATEAESTEDAGAHAQETRP
ncbi:MAG: hypothetical protein AAGI01_09005 [Myxococcota bacterium]